MDVRRQKITSLSSSLKWFPRWNECDRSETASKVIQRPSMLPRRPFELSITFDYGAVQGRDSGDKMLDPAWTCPDVFDR